MANPDLILIGTGSEVNLLLKAQEKLKEKSIQAASSACLPGNYSKNRMQHIKKWFFRKISANDYRLKQASTQGWLKYTTEDGRSLGLNHFGESAPAEEIFKEFGFTVENIVTLAEYL